MGSGLRSRLIAVHALVLFLFIFLNPPAISRAQRPGEAFVYCYPEAYRSGILLSYLSNSSDWKVTLCDLNDSVSLRRFFNLTQTLTVLGVEIFPSGLCTPCLLKRVTWDEIVLTYASPLVGFFRDGRLAAITIGTVNPETLDQALTADDEDVRVLTDYDAYSLSEVSTQLEGFFPIDRNEKGGVDASNLVLPLTLLALADSVNPCTFALFTALLFMAMHSLGGMRAATTALSFISAVFIGYYALGLGAFQVLAAIPYVDKALETLGLVLGVLNIVRGFRVSFKSPIPSSFRRLIESGIRKSYASVSASFVLGLVATFTLLPCSGGPYIVGLGLLSSLKDLIQVHLLLTLYNLIFVAPLALIAVAVLASRNVARKIKIARTSKLGIIELTSGLVLAAICLYLLLT